jgi:zinc/manganese transport system permease protein
MGFIHWLARKPLLLVTENPEEARSRHMKIGWWDFLFYATFGFVVTSSVKVAGVLLVFAFLIIPSVAAMIAVEGTAKRITFGWIFGLIGCIAGLELSMRLDWSTGPAIVMVFLVFLIITWLTQGIKKQTGSIQSLMKTFYRKGNKKGA